MNHPVPSSRMLGKVRRWATCLAAAAVAVTTAATAPAVAETGTAAGSAASVQDRVNAALRSWMYANGVSNAGLAVMRDNDLVGSYGYNEMSAESPANVASLSKAITGVCVMSLVDNGRLGLGTRLGSIRGLRLTIGPRAARIARNITIEELLRHRSGITFDPSQAGLAGIPNADSSDVILIRRALSRPLAARPAAESYNNVNYALLGHVIQVVSGEPYESYCRRMALAPRGANGRIGPGTRAMGAFGGWEISAVDYAMFARAYDKRSRLMSPAAHRFIDAMGSAASPTASLGMYVVHAPKGRNLFHHGNWRSTATTPNEFSAFFAMWNNGVSVVVTYDRMVSDAARVSLDNMLREAAFSQG
ncbi:serine hydrolase domain-containing protein [Thermoactinospora rubra]|uniref:serine hydrolase domain-containing protein n=1 Tax=Thermoactinospora rubra TaxID=1088767 RepID=UPI001180BF80|nr:serine hydrolase domain-containing protein [Thermoactinospora rubra]